nr:salicylate carboxymethyltransferase-like [Tanacetum cinerariifolium]
MDLVKFFHMNGGIGDTSYSKNGGDETKGVIEQAISDLCRNNVHFPKTLVMADLGCSSGPNTLLVGSMVIDAVAKTSLEMGLLAPEVQINLNDLPTNDFNTIFSALHDFQENTTIEEIIDDHHPPTCYFTGVPGSFFSRLFPANTLHFVHSSYSLQWLSQLPELEEINKGHIYLSSMTPESVSKAYYQQFQKDFSGFLMCRAEEMMGGGRMVLTLAGRTTDDARGEESYYLWRPLAMALQEMVFEGLVDEAKLDSFNLPQYTASPTEIMNLVECEGSFTLDHLKIFDVNWEAWKIKNYDKYSSHSKKAEGHVIGHGVAKAIRAGIESLVSNHFGEAIVDDVFTRYEKFLAQRMSTEKKEAVVSITISLTKKCDI